MSLRVIRCSTNPLTLPRVDGRCQTKAVVTLHPYWPMFYIHTQLTVAEQTNAFK